MRLGFHRRSVGRSPPRWWRRPSGSPSRPDVEPSPGVVVGFTSSTLLPVEAALLAREPSCVRDGLQRPGSGQVSVLRTEILGAAPTSPTPPHRPDHPRGELPSPCSRDPRVASHAPGDQRRACQDHHPSYAVSQLPSDKVLCSAKGRTAPLPAACESAVFRSAPLQSTAVRFRRRRGVGEAAGRSSVQFTRKRRLCSPIPVLGPADDRA